MQDLRTAPSALTTLSEEEAMFRDAVREFAETDVKPHVHAMDEAAQFRPELIPRFFELGLMGIEVPEQYGGAGGGIFLSALAIEEIARVDASAAIYVDVHNTLVTNALASVGHTRAASALLSQTHQRSARRLRSVGAGERERCLRSGDPGGAKGHRLGADRTKVLDHQRRRGRGFHRLRERRPIQGL